MPHAYAKQSLCDFQHATRICQAGSLRFSGEHNFPTTKQLSRAVVLLPPPIQLPRWDAYQSRFCEERENAEGDWVLGRVMGPSEIKLSKEVTEFDRNRGRAGEELWRPGCISDPEAMLENDIADFTFGRTPLLLGLGLELG